MDTRSKKIRMAHETPGHFPDGRRPGEIFETGL